MVTVAFNILCSIVFFLGKYVMRNVECRISTTYNLRNIRCGKKLAEFSILCSVTKFVVCYLLNKCVTNLLNLCLSKFYLLTTYLLYELAEDRQFCQTITMAEGYGDHSAVVNLLNCASLEISC